MVRRVSRTWTPAQREQWLHNMFLGFAKSTMLHMDSIIKAATTTDESRALAADIYHNAQALDKSLRTRRSKSNATTE